MRFVQIRPRTQGKNEEMIIHTFIKYIETKKKKEEIITRKIKEDEKI